MPKVTALGNVSSLSRCRATLFISHSPHATSSSLLGDTCRLLTSLCFVPSSPCAPRESLLLGELLMPQPGPSCGIRSRPKTDGGSPQARFVSPHPLCLDRLPIFIFFGKGLGVGGRQLAWLEILAVLSPKPNLSTWSHLGWQKVSLTQNRMAGPACRLQPRLVTAF